jgi:hypothetical protein
MALSNKRKYPVTEFKAFVESARHYIEITAGDPMIHRCVVQAVSGFREFLQMERKRIPGDFCLRRTGWSASSSLATIPASTAMSLPAYESSSHQTIPARCYSSTLRDKGGSMWLSAFAAFRECLLTGRSSTSWMGGGDSGRSTNSRASTLQGAVAQTCCQAATLRNTVCNTELDEPG